MNSLKEDVTNKYVILRGVYFNEEHKVVEKRIFKCTGGFGCVPYTSGKAIYGYFTSDNEKCRVEGFMLERLATEEEIKEVKFP